LISCKNWNVNLIWMMHFRNGRRGQVRRGLLIGYTWLEPFLKIKY
jgi:hypothetical protein